MPASPWPAMPTGSLPTGPPPSLRIKRFIRGSSASSLQPIPKPANFDGNGVCDLVKHPLSVLLVCWPLGVTAAWLQWSDSTIFWLNFFAMIPLAKLLGDVTEELAAGLKNDLLAGLLNATFGNIVEMVLTVQTLRQGLYDVVKATLLGSVLSNVLLVLGMSFFFGGLVNIRDSHQKGGSQPREVLGPTTKSSLNSLQRGISPTFADWEAEMASSRNLSKRKDTCLHDPAELEMAALVASATSSRPSARLHTSSTPLAPAAAKRLNSKGSALAESEPQNDRDEELEEESEGALGMLKEVAFATFVADKVQRYQVLGALVNTSMLLLSCLSFSLVTVFRSISAPSTSSGSGASPALIADTLLPVSRICSLIIISAYIAYIIFQLGTHSKVLGGNDEEEEPEEASISLMSAVVLLCIATVLVSWSSELLVQSIEGVTKQAHLGEHFIGIILLPIIGNACEHAAAVRFAMQDKPGLSIGIAVGSSTQIALFVVPFSVLAGWLLDKPMDLDFGALNTTVMTLSVIVVLSMVVDGSSNWLQGYLLCAAYAVIAVLYWFVPNGQVI